MASLRSRRSSGRSLRGAIVLAWLAVTTIWGSTWAVIKIGLADLPPITFACARFVLALAALGLLIYLRRSKLPTRAQIPLLVKTGVLQFTLTYGLIFWAEGRISSGLAAVLQATIPLFGFLIAHRELEDERMSVKRLGALLLGITGVAVIFSDQLQLGSTSLMVGSAAVLLSAFTAAYSTVLVKKSGAGIDVVVLVAGQMFFGLLPLVVYSLLVEGNPLRAHWTLSALLSIVYLALIGTVAAFVAFYWLVKRVEVTIAQITSLLTPFIAVLVGFLFLGERMDLRALAGGAMILASIAVILFAKNQEPVEVAVSPDF